jgi:hypothetical protein
LTYQQGDDRLHAQRIPLINEKWRASLPAAFVELLERLVAIVIRLVRPTHRHAEVICLLLREHRQLHADFLQVQPRDLFVEGRGQYVDADLVGVLVLPQVERRQRLVAEAVLAVPLGDEFPDLRNQFMRNVEHSFSIRNTRLVLRYSVVFTLILVSTKNPLDL